MRYRAAPSPAAPRARSSPSTSRPRALLPAPVEDALPQDLSGIVIELTEHELFGAEGELEARAGRSCAPAARASRSTTPAPATPGLQQLIRIAPDILKLDRALVHGAHADPARATRCWRR